MIKVVCLFKKREDITREEFRSYYENNHLKLFTKYLQLPGIERHVRRYLTPMTDPISGETRNSGFDVILEVWIKDEGLFKSYFESPLEPSFRQIVADDEARFFDRGQLFFHTVEEVDTELQSTAPRPV